MTIPTDAEYARELDRRDELAGFRERFVVDDPALVYLDGNSLGRLSVAAVRRAEGVVREEWGRRLIGGWNDGWIGLSERVGGKIAALLGAAPDEVIVADSTSVCLFKLAVAALRSGLTAGRTRVVTDALNFPSDLYVLGSALALAGHHGELVVIPAEDGISVPPEALAAAVDDRTALVALSHAAFKTAYVHDMAAVTALAHAAGALMLWDLSHSAGALPLALNAAGVDLAVGCTYKYLNGGPGAPAFLFVRRGLQEQLRNPVAGWLGHGDPFAFAPEYQPAPGLRRFVTGTPPVLSLALVEPGVDLLLEAGLDRVRAKSVTQTEYLVALWEALLAPLGFRLGSPRDSARRGSHVSLAHPEGLRLSRALAEQKQVITDFRLPDSIRLGVCPLYTTFAEVHAGITALRAVLEERSYDAYPAERTGAT